MYFLCLYAYLDCLLDIDLMTELIENLLENLQNGEVLLVAVLYVNTGCMCIMRKVSTREFVSNGTQFRTSL